MIAPSNTGRAQPVLAPRGDEDGGLPVAMGNDGKYPLITPDLAVASRQRRGGPGLIDEHSHSGLSAGCGAREARRAATSGRSCSAACTVSFSRQPASLEEAADRRRADRMRAAAEPVLQLGDGAMRRHCQQRLDPRDVIGELGPPPADLGASVPWPRQRCSSFTTQLGLSSNFAAVARRKAPASTARTSRSRRSSEYGRAIAGLPYPAASLNHSNHTL